MNNHVSRLGIGTVQIGMPYGLSSGAVVPGDDEVARMLRAGFDAGIRTLDTAFAYGSSEAVLGRVLPAIGAFEVVTKTKVGCRASELAADFQSSLERLKLSSIHGLLVHKFVDLEGKAGDELWKRMLELKAAGLVKKIGVSVYDAAQIESLLSRFRLDLIQLPVSILDQRLVKSPWLKTLKKEGVEIHARSAFLQGLLLREGATVPAHLASAIPALEKVRSWAAGCGLSMLEASLGYVLSLPEVDRVIVGCRAEARLREIVAATHKASSATFPVAEVEALALWDEQILNPANWKKA